MKYNTIETIEGSRPAFSGKAIENAGHSTSDSEEHEESMSGNLLDSCIKKCSFRPTNIKMEGKFLIGDLANPPRTIATEEEPVRKNWTSKPPGANTCEGKSIQSGTSILQTGEQAGTAGTSHLSIHHGKEDTGRSHWFPANTHGTKQDALKEPHQSLLATSYSDLTSSGGEGGAQLEDHACENSIHQAIHGQTESAFPTSRRVIRESAGVPNYPDDSELEKWATETGVAVHFFRQNQSLWVWTILQEED